MTSVTMSKAQRLRKSYFHKILDIYMINHIMLQISECISEYKLYDQTQTALLKVKTDKSVNPNDVESF